MRALQAAEKWEEERQKPVITVLKDAKRIIISRKTQEQLLNEDTDKESSSEDEAGAELAATQVKQASYDRIAQRRGSSRFYCNSFVNALVYLTILQPRRRCA